MHHKQVDTAVLALAALAASDRGRRVSASELAHTHGLSAPSVAKTLHALARAGLVAGAPGPGGGYVLARDPQGISLHDVLRIFGSGDLAGLIPFAGLFGPLVQTATVGRRVEAIRTALESLLMETTVADLADRGGIPVRTRDRTHEDRSGNTDKEIPR